MMSTFIFYAKLQKEVSRVKKGQKKRVWTREQKSEIVHKHLDEHVSLRELEKAYKADRSMICKWAKKYILKDNALLNPKSILEIHLQRFM